MKVRNQYGRRPETLQHVTEDLHHFAPIPLIYRDIDVDNLASFNSDLADIARGAFTLEALEVPDRRHIDDLGTAPEEFHDSWSETQPTPVGIWHRVPTNNHLDRPEDTVKRLRHIIEDRYLFALLATGEVADISRLTPVITESWIQFYRNGDDKVLHNHERYGPPYPRHPWSGAYYLDDGDPDESMPYAGVFSFRVRNQSYFIRPRAGLLMLWPSDVLHEVHPFYGKRERIVVNFNINTGFPDDEEGR